MIHIEHHHSPCSASELFDLVVDVEQYPKFLPWVIDAKVLRRTENTLWVEMTMGVSLFSKRFRTVAVLQRSYRLEIKGDDRMFEWFEQIWTFAPSADGGTDVEYRVDFKFKSHLIQALIERGFAARAKRMLAAYIDQAQRKRNHPPAFRPGSSRPLR